MKWKGIQMVKANPGGSLDPKFIFGRDRLIEQIWNVLDRQCVLLNAERRIGKTSIVGTASFASISEG